MPQEKRHTHLMAAQRGVVQRAGVPHIKRIDVSARNLHQPPHAGQVAAARSIPHVLTPARSKAQRPDQPHILRVEALVVAIAITATALVDTCAPAGLTRGVAREAVEEESLGAGVEGSAGAADG